MRSRRSKWRKARLAEAARVREMERILDPAKWHADKSRRDIKAAMLKLARQMNETRDNFAFQTLKQLYVVHDAFKKK